LLDFILIVVQFTVVDAGYTTTDYVLNALLARKECKWVSATNGDNAYGSEVVERILSASHAPGSTKLPDMLLLPMDSRNFADQGNPCYHTSLYFARVCLCFEGSVTGTAT
jgi:hypothetical protein